MTAKEKLLQEIQYSPEPLLQKVLDFLLFTKSRHYLLLEHEALDKQETHQPIWEFAQELMQDAPPEALALLPVDSPRNHDHCLW